MTVDNTSHNVTMKVMQKLISSVDSSIAICIRGRHAVGKSEGVYQAAAMKRSDFYKNAANCANLVERLGGKVKHANGWKSVWTYEDGVPVMERRLSQMTEGDTIGLPFNGEHGTQFKACDWLIMACDFPMVVFLDERNRALDAVKQSVFQLCDSKAFYGNRLHNESHVIIAENVGGSYQVQDCDPAEVSRCATMTLDPKPEEWLEYAKSQGAFYGTIDFIRANKAALEHLGNVEPNKKYPDRRSWFKLDRECSRLGLFDDPTNDLFYNLVCTMIGVEWGIKFTNFVKEMDRQISAQDILTDWKKAKSRLAGKGGKISNEMYMEVVEKVGDHLEKHTINEAHRDQLVLFGQDLPNEIRMKFWSAIASNTKNLKMLNGELANLVVRAARAASGSAPSEEVVKDASSTGGTSKRGRRAKK